MNEDEFKILFQKIVDFYQITPEIAEELLQRILAIIAKNQASNDLW